LKAPDSSVAWLRATTRRPVAIGSSVPRCPAFLALTANLTASVVSIAVQSLGLSISTIAFSRIERLRWSGSAVTMVGAGGAAAARPSCCWRCRSRRRAMELSSSDVQPAASSKQP
jgi:hypothetical protein